MIINLVCVVINDAFSVFVVLSSLIVLYCTMSDLMLLLFRLYSCG